MRYILSFIGLISALLAGNQLLRMLPLLGETGGIAGIAQRVAIYDFLTFAAFALGSFTAARIIQELVNIRMATERGNERASNQKQTAPANPEENTAKYAARVLPERPGGKVEPTWKIDKA